MKRFRSLWNDISLAAVDLLRNHAGFTINETIEAYCGAEIPGEEIERGFSKDRKDGYRASKSCRSFFRYMAGYNHRQSLVEFDEDEDGYGIHRFKSNTHLRINKAENLFNVNVNKKFYNNELTDII